MRRAFRPPISRLALVPYIRSLRMPWCHTPQHRHHQLIRYPHNTHNSPSLPTGHQHRTTARCIRPPQYVLRLLSTSSRLILDPKDLYMYHQSRKTTSMGNLFRWTRLIKTWFLRTSTILFKCISFIPQGLLIPTADNSSELPGFFHVIMMFMIGRIFLICMLSRNSA